MSKRVADTNTIPNKSIRTEGSGGSGPSARSKDVDMQIDTEDTEEQFEDLYEDEFESDGEIFEVDGNDEDEDEDLELTAEQQAEQAAINAQRAVEEDQKQATNNEESSIYLPHRSRPLGPDEVLEADPTVYEMLHTINVQWPSLSFDIFTDSLGNERRNYPQSVYLVAGTQAARPKDNELTVMKMSSLGKTLIKNDDEESDNEDEDDNDDIDVDPILEHKSLPLNSTTNRVRLSPHSATTGEHLAASMSENGDAYIWNLSTHFKSFDTPGTIVSKQSNKPVFTVRAHGNVEGYALDWSPKISSGALLTGDCSGRIHLTVRDTSNWRTDKLPFLGHQGSVEELQWSRTENTVFASGGTDGFIKIWDTRSKKHKASLSVRASNSDVNVMTWSSKISHLLGSGHDDGTWGVWDLRSFKSGTTPTPVASFDFHKAPITSIEFHPTEESILAVASEDNTVTLWDLGVEADDEEITIQKNEAKGELEDIPPQLLFVHWQKDVKEVHWHKQIPGALVSTGGNGIAVWKTISV